MVANISCNVENCRYRLESLCTKECIEIDMLQKCQSYTYDEVQQRQSYKDCSSCKNYLLQSTNSIIFKPYCTEGYMPNTLIDNECWKEK
jgi:hypothetical protein